MPNSVAKHCCNVKQDIATPARHDMDMEKKTARQVLAENMARLMEGSGYNQPTIERLAKGDVVQRSVSNLLNATKDTANSPKLSTLEAVANVFGLEVWQLLLNQDTVGDQFYTMLMALKRTPPVRTQLVAIQGNKDEDTTQRGEFPDKTRRSSQTQKK